MNKEYSFNIKRKRPEDLFENVSDYFNAETLTNYAESKSIMRTQKKITIRALELLELKNNCSLILDAGCGPGFAASYLKELGYEIVALDIISEFLMLFSSITKDGLDPTHEKYVGKLAEYCEKMINYFEEYLKSTINTINKLIEKKNCTVLGTFDCVGENLGIPEETQMAMLNRLPEDQRKKAEDDMKKIKGRPNAKDLENAKKFVQILLKNH